MPLVDLPVRPGPGPIEWEQMDFGGTLESMLGGSAQRVNRLGNRWRVTVTMPTMTTDHARAWEMALNRGRRHGVRWPIRQVGIHTGSPGSPLVDGSDQAGDVLNTNGFRRSTPLRVGQGFSILTGGARYVHKMAVNVRAAADGSAALEIEPPLRVSPDDGAVLEFGKPYIEGLLEDVPPSGYRLDQLANGFSFTIAEQR